MTEEARPGPRAGRTSGLLSLVAAGCLTGLLAVPASARQAPGGTRLVVVLGVQPDGMASAEWLAILRQRSSSATYDSVAVVRKPLTDREAAWAARVRARATAWQGMVAPIAALYRPVTLPAQIRIVLGNRGADDAFTYDDRTIGFDLSRLEAVYGGADEPVNTDRLDRFFRHELNHVLQKAWLALHPWEDRSPLGAALLDIWTEGLGNYFSLSDRWVSSGRFTPEARATLDRLEPQFVASLDTLACGDSSRAAGLLHTLSSGPFDRKWGALPAALWLAADSEPADSALRRLVVAGPQGVWRLAERHLAPPLRARLRHIRSASARCRPAR